MKEFKFFISILRRANEKAYTDYYEKYNVSCVFSNLCYGTATKSIMDYLGLENNEKIMLASIISTDTAKKIMPGLVSKMGINLPGEGIALTVPLGSIAGNSSLMYLAEGQNPNSEESVEMNEEKYALIIVICEKGCSDMVMDAAKKAGAGGGTVVHAKGTATKFTQKFFGVSMAAEKELVYIVTKKSDKDAIMKAVIENAGPLSEAKSAAFSLPVDDVVGLCSITDE